MAGHGLVTQAKPFTNIYRRELLFDPFNDLLDFTQNEFTLKVEWVKKMYICL